jgi:hypothetical protein
MDDFSKLPWVSVYPIRKNTAAKLLFCQGKKGVLNLKWGMGGFGLFPRECVGKADGAAEISWLFIIG